MIALLRKGLQKRMGKADSDEEDVKFDDSPRNKNEGEEDDPFKKNQYELKYNDQKQTYTD